jgi:hypothetical protein
VFCYNRYGDGGFLSPDDEKVIVEKVLAHHPRSEDKIGCGLDAILVSYGDNLYFIRHASNKSIFLFCSSMIHMDFCFFFAKLVLLIYYLKEIIGC